MFVDCSARFCKVETMTQFTTWDAGGREFWFYQSLADILDPGLLEDINVTLEAKMEHD